MSLIRLAENPQLLEQGVALSPDAEPALRIWQARPGEVLTVVSPSGVFYRARLLPDGRQVRPFAVLPPLVEPVARRRLCQAIPDRERMLWIIQKAVELGVTEIQPLMSQTANAIKTGKGADKSATWGKVALTAAKQCRRAIVPVVAPPCGLEALLAEMGPEEAQGVLFLDVLGERTPLAEAVLPLATSPITLLVGPEGGWTDGERQILIAAYARPVSLGERILRTETAAIAALAVIAALESPSRVRPL